MSAVTHMRRCKSKTYFFLGLRLACARSEPATVFSDLLDFLLLSSFEAFDAGFFPVTMTRSENA